MTPYETIKTQHPEIPIDAAIAEAKRQQLNEKLMPIMRQLEAIRAEHGVEQLHIGLIPGYMYAYDSLQDGDKWIHHEKIDISESTEDRP